MQSESSNSLSNKNLKEIIVLLIVLIFFSLITFRNLFFQSTYLLKNFGELSVAPEVAFNNNKPTFLEFYAEWCEVCKEMAPKVSALKEEYENDINFVFLNVDNQKWGSYIRKFNVNGIPQINIFDEKGNLISTFIGKQEEIKIKDSIAKLQSQVVTHEEITSSRYSEIKENKNHEIKPRSHG